MTFQKLKLHKKVFLGKDIKQMKLFKKTFNLQEIFCLQSIFLNASVEI